MSKNWMILHKAIYAGLPCLRFHVCFVHWRCVIFSSGRETVIQCTTVTLAHCVMGLVHGFTRCFLRLPDEVVKAGPAVGCRENEANQKASPCGSKFIACGCILYDRGSSCRLVIFQAHWGAADVDVARPRRGS